MLLQYEFRVPEEEEYVHSVFSPTEGVKLSESTRKILVRGDDPRIPRIAELARLLKKENRYLFYGWDITYKYTRAEIAAAELFNLTITAIFEPAGWDCGTEHDYLSGCPDCGVPRVQKGDLILDLRKAPKTKDIAGTLSDDEWIITQRLAEILVDAKLTGFELQRVRHKARYEDDAMDFNAVPAGKEILRLATEAGYPHPSGPFWCWLNRQEQKALLERMTAEWVAMRGERARRRGKPPPIWYQLVITSPPVRCVPPTVFGIKPFNEDPDGKYRCPRLRRDKSGQHVAGLALLSEVSVRREDWDGSDICFTAQRTGWVIPRDDEMKGSPGPAILISPRFRQVLLEHKIKGYKTDVAYLR